MIKLIIFLLTLSLVHSSLHQQKSSLPHSSSQKNENFYFNWQISTNITGAGVTPGMQDTLIANINNAYSLYQDDLRQGCQLISRQLRQTYAIRFTVIIMLDHQNTGSWQGRATDQIYLLWKGVNKMRIQWNYLIWGLSDQDVDTMDFIDIFGHGIGISYPKTQVIDKLILLEDEKSVKCDCSNVGRIIFQLKTLDQQEWGIVCKANGDGDFMHASIASFDRQYMLTSPVRANCEYLAYAIKST